MSRGQVETICQIGYTAILELARRCIPEEHRWNLSLGSLSQITRRGWGRFQGRPRAVVRYPGTKSSSLGEG